MGALCAWSEQGLRLGPLAFHSVGYPWPVLALVLALVLRSAGPPTRVGGRRAAGWALTLGLAAVTAAPLFAWRRETLRSGPGIPAAIFRRSLGASARLRRPESVEPVDLLSAQRHLPVHRLAGRSRDVEVVLTGVLYAPEAGWYRFRWLADGDVSVTVDGARLAAIARLERGAHRFEVDYVPGGLEPFLQFTWDRPALLEPLSFEYFVAGRAADLDPRSLGRKELLALSSSLLVAGWWALAGLTAVLAGERAAHRRERIRMASSPTGEPSVLGRPRSPLLGPTGFALVSGLVLVVALQLLFRPVDPEDPFFRAASSEHMMQTVSAADLRAQPVRSLWYLHIEPPMLDTIRMVIAVLVDSRDDRETVERVDAWLYLLWGLNYALLGALVCFWLCRTTRPGFAVLATLAFLLHPAPILYSTLLDGTLLSASAVTWFYFELWRMQRVEGSRARLLAATLALFFTRALFQWPFLLVACLALALWTSKCSRKRVLWFATAAGLVVGLFTVKQYALFGLTVTSSFAGYNGCRSIGADVGWDFGPTAGALPKFPPPSAAAVLAREKKVDGEYNFNQLSYLRISFHLMERYVATLTRQPLAKTLSAYSRNLSLYLRPSSEYGVNPIVDPLPWRGLYDRVFSGWPWLAALAASGLWWLGWEGPACRMARIGLSLPAAYVVLVSVLFESGENMRFKFFIEPVVYVLLATTCYRVWREGGGPFCARVAALLRRERPRPEV
jgi:hypothetical protein